MAQTGARTYAEIEDIERLIGDIVDDRHFDTATVPTADQVAVELDNAAADLNRELDAAGYSIPVDQADYPSAWEFLKAANAYGAAAMLLSTMPWEGHEPTEDVITASISRAQTYVNRFKDAKKAIQESRLRAAKWADISDLFVVGPRLDSDGNTKLPLFTRDQDNYPGTRTLTE